MAEACVAASDAGALGFTLTDERSGGVGRTRALVVGPAQMRVLAGVERTRRRRVLEQILERLWLERAAEEESLAGVAVLLL